jgi:hypothetical protein
MFVYAPFRKSWIRHFKINRTSTKTNKYQNDVQLSCLQQDIKLLIKSGHVTNKIHYFE